MDEQVMIDQAVARLRAGGLVAFPTETVYGLGADATNAEAIARVYAIKGRPGNNPLIVHVDGQQMARGVSKAWPEAAWRLADAFWPGPLSIVVERSETIPAIAAGGGESIAVRCPAHPLTLRLIRELGKPLVGPSANPSGGVSPTRAEHVRASFAERDVLVLAGGPGRGGIESTVVSLCEARARVLRPGMISAYAIAAVLGGASQMDAGGGGGDQNQPDALRHDAPMASPGMLERHYAPRTPARLIEMHELASALSEVRGRAIVLSHLDVDVPPPHALRTMPATALGYAAGLYAALREADICGAACIVIVRPGMAILSAHANTAQRDEASLWAAIVDRLTRATSST
jgi:L-threonylcarbamoyladenylate synthase